jgi:hypothetical protein
MQAGHGGEVEDGLYAVKGGLQTIGPEVEKVALDSVESVDRIPRRSLDPGRIRITQQAVDRNHLVPEVGQPHGQATADETGCTGDGESATVKSVPGPTLTGCGIRLQRSLGPWFPALRGS